MLRTHVLTVKRAGAGATIVKRSGGDRVMDQDLATDIVRYDATVLYVYVNAGPMKGEDVSIKTRRKDSLARLPPWPRNVLTRFDDI